MIGGFEQPTEIPLPISQHKVVDIHARCHPQHKVIIGNLHRDTRCQHTKLTPRWGGSVEEQSFSERGLIPVLCAYHDISIKSNI